MKYTSAGVSVEIKNDDTALISFRHSDVHVTMQELEELKDLFCLTDLKDQFAMFKND